MRTAGAAISPGARCAFTVDLEEYFEVGLLRDFIPPPEWESLPARARRSVDPLLGHLSRHGANATFFISPWIAESHPPVVRSVHEAGHEVGVLLRVAAREAANEEERRSLWRRVLTETRDRLEQITGRRVVGSRSPGRHHELPAREAMEILAEEGFRYDATLGRPRLRSLVDGADPGSPARVRVSRERPILGVPPTTARLLGRPLFTAGRTAFRVLPLAATRRLLHRNLSKGRLAVFGLRSWEMDPAQPTLPVSLASRVRLYWGLDRVHSRLERLLSDFSFDSVEGVLDARGGASGGGIDETDNGPGEREERDRPGGSLRRMHG